MSDSAFNSISWEAFPPNSTQAKFPLAWHKRSIPYVNDANALQNLDIWIPSGNLEVPKPTDSALPVRQDLPWVIYIHGGAWRDPFVDSSSFNETVRHALDSHRSLNDRVAGFASINYSLSRYPTHETNPSPPKDPNQPIDASRVAKHPDHIVDVLRALSYLQGIAGFKDNYVLLGHSCGATLAFQVLMQSMQLAGTQLFKPKAVVGLNGLYDLPTLITDPGEKHADIRPVYEAFTREAFGDDQKAWHDVSPISVTDWAAQWERPDGKVVLVQSKEDTLVPYRQTADFLSNLTASAGSDVIELPAGGDHNDLWKVGDRLSDIVEEVVTSLR